MIKKLLKSFLRHNIVRPLQGYSSELLYQNLFDKQCMKANIKNDFYPVGMAANYSLLYLVFRILEDNIVNTIIELGSGDTTILIDQIKQNSCRHICYEHNRAWFDHLRPKLKNVDYRYRDLISYKVRNMPCHWYANVEYIDFDFLLVDGPLGEVRYSRLGCSELIARITNEDFIIVFDDSNRKGEQDTIAHVIKVLKDKKIDFKIRDIYAAKQQTIIASGKYERVCFY